MELHFFTAFFMAGLIFAILRMIAYFLFKEATRPNYLVWFIVAGFLGAISKNWWASEIFIADSDLHDADNHKKSFIGNYKGHEVALFHKYVDNCMSDTLIAYSTKYWDNEDSLEYTIIFPISFSEIGGSIDYYNVSPPKSIKVPSFPFYNPHEKRWTLCKLDIYFKWEEHPNEYEWSE